MLKKLTETESLVNLGNSILNNFDVETFHSTYTVADKYLQTHQKKVCLILLDGFGANILNKYKKDIPFISSHFKNTFSSVYPPTTVAATNGLLLARYPCETGYCGWVQYFKKHNCLVDVFPSINSLTREKVEPPVTLDILKFDNIIDLINKGGKYSAQSFMGFNYKNGENYNYKALFEAADKNLEKCNFTYIYSSEPDHLMHDEGINSEKLPSMLSEFDSLVKTIVNNHKDFLFFLIADHGMVNTLPIFMNDDNAMQEACEYEIPLLEARFAGFFVKNKELFEKNYREKYADKFYLYPKDRILKEQIFGYSDVYSQVFLDGLCDYYMISKSMYGFAKGSLYLLGNHAGGSEEEMIIPLCVFNNEK